MKRSVLTLCSANLLFATAAVSAQTTEFGLERIEPQAPFIQLPSIAPADSGSGVTLSDVRSDGSTTGSSGTIVIQDSRPGEMRDGRRIEVVNERYNSGKVRIRREVTLDARGNYVRHGTWTMYDEEGLIVARGAYQDNEREGDWMRTHDDYPPQTDEVNGDTEGDFALADYESFHLPFTSTAVFRKGVLDGVWIMNDADDNPVFSITFRDGIRHGPATWFHPDGAAKAVVEFRDGVVDGVRMDYDTDSQVLREEEWQAGRKLAMKSEYHGDDQSVKQLEAMYLHSLFVVDIPDDWWSGRTATYHRDGPEERHGSWVSWYDNGQKKLEGAFENDLRAGEFTWWYANSQIRTVGRYDKGEPVGAWVWYHENGQKACQGDYHSGEPFGQWSFWEPSGKLANRVDYSQQQSVAKPEATAEPPPASKPDEPAQSPDN